MKNYHFSLKFPHFLIKSTKYIGAGVGGSYDIEKHEELTRKEHILLCRVNKKTSSKWKPWKFAHVCDSKCQLMKDFSFRKRTCLDSKGHVR